MSGEDLVPIDPEQAAIELGYEFLLEWNARALTVTPGGAEAAKLHAEVRDALLNTMTARERKKFLRDEAREKEEFEHPRPIARKSNREREKALKALIASAKAREK